MSLSLCMALGSVLISFFSTGLSSFPSTTTQGTMEDDESRSVVSNSLWPYVPYSPWNSPGQNTGVGSCFLHQGIFSMQGSNPGLQHCRWILNQLSSIHGCNLKNNRMISVHFQGKPFSIPVIQVYAPTTNAEEAEVEHIPQPLMPKKLKLNSSMMTYKTF